MFFLLLHCVYLYECANCKRVVCDENVLYGVKVAVCVCVCVCVCVHFCVCRVKERERHWEKLGRESLKYQGMAHVVFIICTVYPSYFEDVWCVTQSSFVIVTSKK